MHRRCAGDRSASRLGAKQSVRRPRAAPESGVIGWILAKQAEFYRALSGLIRSAKTDGSAVWGLFGVSFLYGIFHAAGPGHGKAVISSYLVANEETWKRGVTLSFASALLQALVAVLLVGIAAAVLGATAKMMGDTVRVIETASYALIAAFGARLTWIKGREFLSAWRAERSASGHTDHAHHPGHDHGSDQHDLRQDHRHDAECHHRHDHAGAGGPGQVHAHHAPRPRRARMAMTTTTTPATRTGRNRKSLPVPAAGSAD